MSDIEQVPHRVSPTEAVGLREVTEDNLRTILSLAVAEHQEHLVADNATSIAQGCYAADAWYRAIYAGDRPVGFVMLSLQPEKPQYYVWRFMIDHRFQRMGLGRRAMEQIIAFVRGQPGAHQLLVSYVPEDGSPQPFYSGLGFVDTGEVHDGEMIMSLEL
jgi:diamine N-acetyltransferase